MLSVSDANNDPVNLSDPSGLVVDTVADAAFVGLDVAALLNDNVFGDCDNLAENLMALGADGLGLAIPFATGGGLAIRAAFRSRRLAKLSKVAKRMPCLCFAEDTQARTADGTRAIDALEAGDVVLTEVVDEDERPEPGWRELDAAATPSGCQSSGGPLGWLLTVLGVLALRTRRRFGAALFVGMAAALCLVSCDPSGEFSTSSAESRSEVVELSTAFELSSDPSSDASSDLAGQPVQAFDARKLRWYATWLTDVQLGQDLVADGVLYRRVSGGLQPLGAVNDQELSAASVTLRAGLHPAAPERHTLVLVWGDGPVHHARLDELSPGQGFAYGGWLYATRGEGRVTGVRATGRGLGRVVHPHRRVAESSRSLTVRFADGGQDTWRATSEHPFWVPAREAWVPLEELQVGDGLWTEDGVAAEVVDNTVVDGDVEVFNVEVQGGHNYFVVGVDGDAVLVHNGCGPTGTYVNTHAGGKKYFGKGSETRARVSARKVEVETGDPLVRSEHMPSANSREAFKAEDRLLQADGGPKSNTNYNKINSPGKKYREQDGD